MTTHYTLTWEGHVFKATPCDAAAEGALTLDEVWDAVQWKLKRAQADIREQLYRLDDLVRRPEEG